MHSSTTLTRAQRAGRPIALISSVVFLVILTVGASGQSDALRVQVPAGRDVKSPLLTTKPGEAIVVRAQTESAAANPVVRFFAYQADGTLVGLSDPEKPSDVVRLPVSEGSYYVLFRNGGDVDAVMTVGAEPVRASVKALNVAVERVFFATDRKRAASTFAGEPAAGVSYGHSDVSVPRAAHHMGELEGPSVWRLEFSPDASKHIVMGPIVDASERLFLADVRDKVKQSQRRECLIFVHGFNVPFDEAVRRTAQIAYDIAFDGAPILFSWPSQGGMWPSDYRKDERNAALSIDSLHRLLTLLGSNVPGVAIHIVAHSMGSRVVEGALERLSAETKPSGRKPLAQVAFLAPDIDAELFRRAVGKLSGAATRVTLYASDKDDALLISAKEAGYKRAGQAGPGLVVAPGIDTIDASAVNTAVLGLGHSYYADNSTILSDLFYLIRGQSPAERSPRLEVLGRPPNSYWRFRPAVR